MRCREVRRNKPVAAGVFAEKWSQYAWPRATLFGKVCQSPSSGPAAPRGYQHPLALSRGSFALAARGAGLLSLDAFTFEGAAARPARAKR